MHGEVPETRKIQLVEPDHGAGTVLSVVMKIPTRGKNKVTSSHSNALAVDGGKSAIALYYKPHRKCGVAMCRCCFIGHDQLQTCVDSISCIGSICIFSFCQYLNNTVGWRNPTYPWQDLRVAVPAFLLASRSQGLPLAPNVGGFFHTPIQTVQPWDLEVVDSILSSAPIVVLCL